MAPSTAGYGQRPNRQALDGPTGDRGSTRRAQVGVFGATPEMDGLQRDYSGKSKKNHGGFLGSHSRKPPCTENWSFHIQVAIEHRH